MFPVTLLVNIPQFSQQYSQSEIPSEELTPVPTSDPSEFTNQYLPSLLLSAVTCVLTRASPSGTCLMAYSVPDTEPSRMSSLTPKGYIFKKPALILHHNLISESYLQCYTHLQLFIQPLLITDCISLMYKKL